MDWKGKRAGRPRSQSLGFAEGEKGGMGVDVESVRGDWCGKGLDVEGNGEGFGLDEVVVGFGGGGEVGVGLEG